MKVTFPDADTVPSSLDTIKAPLDPILLFAPPATKDVEQGLQDIDAVLANALQQLDLEERERALNDLHGINNYSRKENPICLKKWLNVMEERLNKIKHGTALQLAQTLDFAYVADIEMRLMFLRSTDYDPIRAAEKMVYFFEVKRECFGVEKLAKDITLEDLEQEDKDIIKSGYLQVLPFKDMSGREIMMIQASLRPRCSLQSEDRAKFFMLMEYAKRAIETKSRFTVVYFGLDAVALEASRLVGLWFAVPLRVSGIHICNESVHELVRDCYGIVTLPARSLARTRVHLGSYAQCHSSLSAYGIPSHLLPVKLGDSPNISHHLEWYKQLEEETAKKLSMSSPLGGGRYTAKDVLFGHKRNHTGNALMRKLVEKHQETYDISPKAGKVKLARDIVEQIQQAGGRFLRRDDDGDWVEVSNDKARDKVAHTFRNLRRCNY